MTIQIVDIVTSDISHVTKQYIYLYIIHVMYVKIYINLYSAKRMVKYNPGKIVIHGCKLHM